MAIAGSVFVHLLVAFSLAAFGRSSPPLPELEAPLELTMVDLSPVPQPTVPPNPAYVETDPSKQTEEEPEEKTFESNANSRAASALPATGDALLPSQEGRESPFLNLETQDSSLAMQGRPAQPAQPTPPPPPEPTPGATPRPVETPVPQPSPPPTATPLPEPLATPRSDQLAMLTSTPPPAMLDPEETEATVAPRPSPTPPSSVALRPLPERPASAYQPEKTETRITGRITDRGPSSVNAVGTPLGRYQKAVYDAIGSRWYFYTKSNIDLVNIGTAIVEAEVDSEGKVRDLKLVSNDSNEAFANVCLQSFQEAQIPPIPPDLVATLPDGRLQVTISFVMYASP